MLNLFRTDRQTDIVTFRGAIAAKVNRTVPITFVFAFSPIFTYLHSSTFIVENDSVKEENYYSSLQKDRKIAWKMP